MTTSERIRYSEAKLALRLVSVRGSRRDGLLALPLEGCGMASALALGEPHLSTVRWQSADRCRIAWRGDEWILSNHSRQMVCALNARRIKPGDQAILQLGDTLELDLLSFQLVEQGHVQRQVDPFEGLHVETHRKIVHTDRVAGSVSGTEDDHVLHFLNEEFQSVVRDPTRLSSRADWISLGLRTRECAPTLDELRLQAERYPMLRDILLTRGSIDSVIGCLDDFGEIDLSDREVPPDVLRLFAPDISKHIPPRLAEMTRREHHATSVDSAMSIGRVRPGDDRIAS